MNSKEIQRLLHRDCKNSSGGITSLEALNQFGCLRLSARIKDLRDRGHKIQSVFIDVPSGKRVKQYFMEGGL